MTDPPAAPAIPVQTLEYRTAESPDGAAAARDRTIDQLMHALGVLLLVAGIVAGVAMLCAAYLILLD